MRASKEMTHRRVQQCGATAGVGLQRSDIAAKSRRPRTAHTMGGPSWPGGSIVYFVVSATPTQLSVVPHPVVGSVYTGVGQSRQSKSAEFIGFLSTEEDLRNGTPTNMAD